LRKAANGIKLLALLYIKNVKSHGGMVLKNLLKSGKNEIPHGAVFMSGSGTNAEKVLEFQEKNPGVWQPSVIVTDAPEKSRAAEIAALHGLPLVELSIRAFYNEHGEKKVSLATENGRRVRGLWTNVLREKISEYNIDFGILAGFMPLSNITGDFPCLNVHPGDLTVEIDGRRILAGLHEIPTEQAIIHGFKSIRSSVIIAQPYTGKGGEMDSGPILGVSPEMELDIEGFNNAELKEIYEKRPSKKPSGGWNDALSRIASANQERLKEKGDWIVFPQVVNDFAAGKFAVEDGKLYFMKDNGWLRVETVEYKLLENI
jgi:phosphoribosylglycinamide formyltransferase-1